MKIWILCVTLVSPIVLLAYELETNNLLTLEDNKWLQERNHNGPHLGSFDKDELAWESFDVWQCFDTKNIAIDCAEYDSSFEVPSLVAEESGHTFLFDTHVEDRLVCKKIGETWIELIKNSTQVCVMAAEMPGVFMEGEGTSLWYLHAIKTDSGYWVAN